MIKTYSTRRQFLNYGKLSLLLLLNSCSNSSKKIRISLQSSFYPKAFKDTLPASWNQENINISKLDLYKNKKILSDSDFILFFSNLSLLKLIFSCCQLAGKLSLKYFGYKEVCIEILIFFEVLIHEFKRKRSDNFP